MRTSACALLALTMAAAHEASAAAEDMDFIAEHLAEVSMDNHLLTLPVEYTGDAAVGETDWQLATSYQRIASDALELSGAGAGIGANRTINPHWSLGAFAFADRSSFGGGAVARPVAPLFSDSIPLDLPADAILTDLRGQLSETGAGAFAVWHPPGSSYALIAGLAFEHLRQSGYRVDYTLTTGGSAGATGTLDYSATYRYWIPTLGVVWHWTRGSWDFAPRLQAGVPLPRRGWRGIISGPGFTVSGNTSTSGHGKHMGDPFAGVGLAVTYRPWHVSWDLGTLVSQALIEPRIHEGVSSVWILGLRWQH